MKSTLIPTEIYRRAELFMVIADLVRTANAESDGLESVKPLPTLTVIGRRIVVNGETLDLARRPLMVRLFQAFADSRDGWISRDDLLRKVYDIARSQGKSERYLDSVVGNAVKMISRARAVTGSFLFRSGGPEFDWMVYDIERRGWQLVRARHVAAELALVSGD